MPRYIDTGSDDPNNFLGNWLDANLLDGIQSFRCQFGYFSFSALAPYARLLNEMVTAGKAVHFVLGSNSGSLALTDLEQTRKIVQGTGDASLVVVAYQTALFHPKTIHLTRSDGSTAAAVGSSNFTEQGLGLNVEASVLLDTAWGDDASAIQQVADAVDRWRTALETGVFPIVSENDVQALATQGIIDLPRPPRPVVPSAPGAGGGEPRGTLGTRRRRWRPSTTATQAPATPDQTPPPLPAPQAMLPRLRWCKELKNSDAQQVSGRTNATGKLRLTKSRFPIDKNTFFRQEMFASATWHSEARNGVLYETASVEFSVQVRGDTLGVLSLTIDYGEHRVAGQANVPTVLAWGTRLGQVLSATSCVGDWVIIERDMIGNYSLTIQSTRPTWAP